jgi:hypothetical protein
LFRQARTWQVAVVFSRLNRQKRGIRRDLTLTACASALVNSLAQSALLAFRRLQKAKDIGADFAKRAPLLS